MKKKALGRGIEALIPKKETNLRTQAVSEMEMALLEPGRFQPRINFDAKRHEELVASIREKGVVQPLLVRPAKIGGGKKYEIIAGERRYRALKELNMTKAPVIIREVKDEEALELSLIENIQRQELNAIEEAHAYDRLINEFDLTQEAMSKAVGKDRSTIANSLRLLKLPLAIQDYVSRGTLSMGHARALLALEDKHKQLTVAENIAKNGISVRETEAQVKKASSGQTPAKKTKPTDPYVKAIEDDLQAILGTKVILVQGRKRGKVIIDYYGSADLERLLKLLLRK